LFTIKFSVTGNPVFVNTETSLVTFRMVQEALNNIIKHAAASVIKINLHYTEALLLILICDNGRGFNMDEVRKGSGLQNIKKRTAMLNGNVTINSTLGAGTQINIEIPL
jgi:two-component system, NarL family, sensor kinase